MSTEPISILYSIHAYSANNGVRQKEKDLKAKEIRREKHRQRKANNPTPKVSTTTTPTTDKCIGCTKVRRVCNRGSPCLESGQDCLYNTVKKRTQKCGRCASSRRNCDFGQPCERCEVSGKAEDCVYKCILCTKKQRPCDYGKPCAGNEKDGKDCSYQPTSLQ